MKLFTTILITFTALGYATGVSAQLINLKTAPVATGDQFLLQPAVNAGMANLSIALDDTLADPFINPAKTHKLSGMQIYMLPTFYRITNGYGGARTLSLGGLTAGDTWSGGLGIAVQEIDQAPGGSNLLKDQAGNNNYVWAQAGKRINSSASLGGRLFWAGLTAIDGVDLLYPRSRRIEQDGYMLDLRLGLNGKSAGNGEYEALVLFNRIDMTHEVTYQTVIYNLEFSSIWAPSETQKQVEENLDKTNTWGLHMGYDQPVGEKGWKLGGIATLNYKTHPKIPNYDLMNIPRDPGNTWAFDVGIGTSNTSEDNVTFGADFIIEPIWSNTWVEAQEDISDPDGNRVRVEKGEKTIENDFKFINSVLKTGLGWRGKRVLLQTGILAKTYRYELKQNDYVQGSFRHQKEDWTEWTFSWSAGVIFNSLEIQYLALLTTGTGQPGIATNVWSVRTESNFAATTGTADFIFAPEGDLALNRASVLTHQIAVTIPL